MRNRLVLFSRKGAGMETLFVHIAARFPLPRSNQETDALSLQGLPGTFRRPHGYRAFQKQTSSPQMAHGYLPAAHRPYGNIKHSDSKGIRHHSKDGMVPQSSHPRGHETARGIIRRGSRG